MLQMVLVGGAPLVFIQNQVSAWLHATCHKGGGALPVREPIPGEQES